MNAGQKKRLEKVEKLLAIPTDMPGLPFRIVDVIRWAPDAQRSYEAARRAGDAETVADLMEEHAGIPKPERAPTRNRRRPLVNRPRRIVQLVICGILDEREPFLDDDDDGPTATAPTPPAEPEPIVEPPGSNPSDVVGRDPWGNLETRQDRDNRLAAEAALVAAGRDVPKPDDGPPRFDRWGQLVGGRFRPPAPPSGSFQQLDRSGRPI